MTYDQTKRALDLVIASILCIIFLPIWIVVPLAILIESGPPILFCHIRLGKNGQEFALYKFRSMVPDADDLLHKHNPKLLEEFKNGDWKLKNDPRITKLGRILRSLTIDEFPQLYNVFKGEMSMVGPRAYVKKELTEQAKRYPETKQYIKEILSVKPGITGPWQTNGRNEIPFAQRAQMDARYAQGQSLIEDFRILLMTPKAMLSKW